MSYFLDFFCDLDVIFINTTPKTNDNNDKTKNFKLKKLMKDNVNKIKANIKKIYPEIFAFVR